MMGIPVTGQRGPVPLRPLEAPLNLYLQWKLRDRQDSRGICASLISTGTVHVQCNLFPFAAAVVGIQSVDGHLKLYLEVQSTTQLRRCHGTFPARSLPSSKTDQCPSLWDPGFKATLRSPMKFPTEKSQCVLGTDTVIFVPYSSTPQNQNEKS